MSKLDRNIKELSSLIHGRFSEGIKLSTELSDLRTLLNMQLTRAAGLLTTFPMSYLRGNPATPGQALHRRARSSAANINPRKLYIIQWKCLISGKVGTGSIPLGQEEADQLAAELNRDAPDLREAGR